MFLPQVELNETLQVITNTTAIIDSISVVGIVVIKFNSVMKTKFINST